MSLNPKKKALENSSNQAYECGLQVCKKVCLCLLLIQRQRGFLTIISSFPLELD